MKVDAKEGEAKRPIKRKMKKTNEKH